jgi:hypothetical protein
MQAPGGAAEVPLLSNRNEIVQLADVQGGPVLPLTGPDAVLGS